MDHLYTDLGFKSTIKSDDYDFKGLDQKIVYQIDRKLGADRFLDQEYEKWKKWRESNEKSRKEAQK